MRGCLTCRQRHIKCDKTGTECLRCQRSGRKCIFPPENPEKVTFRHGQNPSLRSQSPPRYGESDLVFPADQVWVYIPPQLAFEDETHHTAADYDSLPSEGPPFYATEDSDGQKSIYMATFPRRSIPGQAESSSRHHGDLYIRSRVDPLKSKPLGDCQKLRTFNEAFLLRWFQNTLGTWLDVCDPERFFSVDVVERAPLCPLLLYACVAIAARHLSYSTSLIPPNMADEYHEKCIAILLPGLKKYGFQIDIEVLLAATVILRFLEQISSHSPSNDQQRHLLAGSVYISSRIDCAISGGLAEASFWVFIMQDIQFALTYRNTLRLTLDQFDAKLRQKWGKSEAQTDRDWTHQAIWLLAEAINYCYGLDNSLQVKRIDREALKIKIWIWDTESPKTFQGLHFSPPNHRVGRPFPVVWFTSSSHGGWHWMLQVDGWLIVAATAVQHICMAKALIHEYELKTMHLSPDKSAEAKVQEDNIIENLYILFGIALSSKDEPCLRVMACHALWASTSWIRDPLSQNCLLDLVQRTEAENGWPWGSLIQKIKQDWRIPTS